MNNAYANLLAAFPGETPVATETGAKVNVKQITHRQFMNLVQLHDHYQFTIKRSGSGVVVIAESPDSQLIYPEVGNYSPGAFLIVKDTVINPQDPPKKVRVMTKGSPVAYQVRRVERIRSGRKEKDLVRVFLKEVDDEG